MKILPYSTQWVDQKDIVEVVKVLKSPWITQGPKISEFEKAIARYVGAKFAVVFNSGTSALHAAYFAIGLKEGDEFITSPITFVATANAGLYLGARPIFVDIEPDTGNINQAKIEAKITKKTKLIVSVHYAGHPVNLERIAAIAKKYDLFVIEDAAHALGAKYKKEKIGNCKYSDVTVFSFHPVKSITTGEGGAVTTNNRDYYNKLLLFRNHGISKKNFKNNSHGDWYYEMRLLGANYRLTDIQAALGLSQLKKVDKFVDRRREIANIYFEKFKNNLFFDLPVEKSYATSSYHLFPIRLKDNYLKKKAKIFANLARKGLGVQVHYIPVYLQPYYQNLGYTKNLCPIAEDFYWREISIPIYPKMKNNDIKYVVKILLASSTFLK